MSMCLTAIQKPVNGCYSVVDYDVVVVILAE